VSAKKTAAKPAAKKTSTRKPRAAAKKTAPRSRAKKAAEVETSVAPPVMYGDVASEPTPRDPGLEGHPLHSVTSSTLNPAFN